MSLKKESKTLQKKMLNQQDIINLKVIQIEKNEKISFFLSNMKLFSYLLIFFLEFALLVSERFIRECGKLVTKKK